MDTPQQRKRVAATLAFARGLVRNDGCDVAIQLLDHETRRSSVASLYDYRGVVLSLVGHDGEALSSFDAALWYAATDIEAATMYYHRSLVFCAQHAYDQTRFCQNSNTILAM